MPIFEYKCIYCGNKETTICSYGNRANVICDLCGSKNIKWLPSCGSFVLDGIMASKHPNSPEGQAKASELRKKHIKNHTHKQFKQENKARAKHDGKWSY